MTTKNDTTQADEKLTFAKFSKDKLLLLQVEIALARVIKHGEDISILSEAVGNVLKRNEALEKENVILKGSLLDLIALK